MDVKLYIKGERIFELIKPLDKLLLINEVNWNILLTSGKEIKRDSICSVNESRLV